MPIDKAAAQAILNSYAEHHSLKAFRKDLLNAESDLRRDLAATGYTVGTDASTNDVGDPNGPKNWMLLNLADASGENTFEVDPAGYLYEAGERVLTRYATTEPSSDALVADLMNKKSALRQDLKRMGFDRTPKIYTKDLDGNGVPEATTYDLVRSDEGFSAPDLTIYNGAEIDRLCVNDALILNPDTLAALEAKVEETKGKLIPAYDALRDLKPDAPEKDYVKAALALRDAKIQVGIEDSDARRALHDYEQGHAPAGETPHTLEYYSRLRDDEGTIHYANGDYIPQ